MVCPSVSTRLDYGYEEANVNMVSSAYSSARPLVVTSQ